MSSMTSWQHAEVLSSVPKSTKAVMCFTEEVCVCACVLELGPGKECFV